MHAYTLATLVYSHNLHKERIEFLQDQKKKKIKRKEKLIYKITKENLLSKQKSIFPCDIQLNPSSLFSHIEHGIEEPGAQIVSLEIVIIIVSVHFNNMLSHLNFT